MSRVLRRVNTPFTIRLREGGATKVLSGSIPNRNSVGTYVLRTLPWVQPAVENAVCWRKEGWGAAARTDLYAGNM